MIAASLTPLHRGLTFSGGEPFLQAAVLAKVAARFKLPLVVYSGFTFEELLDSRLPGVLDLMARTQLLVDGRYVAAERDLSLPFRGSRNQRLIDVQASLKAGKAVERTSLNRAG